MAAINDNYKIWLNELKKHIYSSQIKAALKVNVELLSVYWHLGNEILDKEKNAGWGGKFIDQLSSDLLKEFSQMKGFSRTNLFRIRQWAKFYTQKSPIVSRVMGLPSYDNQQLSGEAELKILIHSTF